MKKTIGIISGVIAFLLLIVALLNIFTGDGAPNQKHGLSVSYYVGTFLPFIIALIVSVACLQPKKKKE